jgi:ethanolamine utilization protein EutQ
VPKQLFTAADIRRIANDLKSTLLVVAPEDLITPEATDVARELGVQIVREAASTQPVATPSISQLTSASLPPLKVSKGAGVLMEAFGHEFATPGTNVRLKDVITSGDGSPMAAGYMALDAPKAGAGEFAWTLSYDEIDIVLEGELVITRGSEVVRGGPGDTIFIPKGSSITFSTLSHARFVYVAFPANWNEGSK